MLYDASVKPISARVGAVAPIRLRQLAPVRVGNDAHGQLQLDVYGEVIDAVTRFAARGGHVDRDTARMLMGSGRRSAGAGANRMRGFGRAVPDAFITPTPRCSAGSRWTG